MYAGRTKDGEPLLTPHFVPLSVITKWPLATEDGGHRRTWYVPYAIVLQVFSTLCVAFRFFAWYRGHTRKGGWDDVFIIFGWLISLGFTGITAWGVQKGGFDRHIWEVMTWAETPGFVAWLSEILFLASTVCTKLSILIFNRRLLANTHKKLAIRAMDFAIFTMVAYGIAYILWCIFVCSPVPANWMAANISWEGDFHCGERSIAGWMAGVISSLSDIYALIIPELMVYNLRIETRRKIVLYLVFGSGLFTVGAAIARTVWVSRLETDPLRDLTWVGYMIMFWGDLECQGTLVCASLPALKALISSVKGNNSNNRSSNKYNKYGNYDKYGTYCTPVDPNSRDRTYMMSAIEEEVADGKGILVTETVSLRSTTRSPARSPDRSRGRSPPPKYPTLDPREDGRMHHPLELTPVGTGQFARNGQASVEERIYSPRGVRIPTYGRMSPISDQSPYGQQNHQSSSFHQLSPSFQAQNLPSPNNPPIAATRRSSRSQSPHDSVPSFSYRSSQDALRPPSVVHHHSGSRGKANKVLGR